jgi:hypothetical protein
MGVNEAYDEIVTNGSQGSFFLFSFVFTTNFVTSKIGLASFHQNI